MSISLGALRRWLNAVPDDAHIAVDEGGLTLIAFAPTGRVYPAYLEVGGHDEDGDCCYRRAEPTVADRYSRTPRD